ncbi:MAG: sugar ABC transporter substrate-binding protein [Acetivibrionales bacterium]|jgi:ribose transport system substrate-binding protein|nr:sugar ABC transporter substrate-binding protein [Clostridiaceae bacterium]
MNKRNRILVSVLLIIGLLATLAGCSNNGNGQDVETTPPAQSEPAPATPSSDEAEGSTELHKVYTLVDQALSGVYSPVLEDRSKVEKALPNGKKENIVIGFSQATQSNPWFVSVSDAMKAASEKYGYDIKIYVADFDAVKASNDIESMITLGCDIIIVDPIEIAASETDVRRAVDAGIPVIGIGVGFTDPDIPIVTTILSNSYENGWSCGSYSSSHFEKGPLNAAVIIGAWGSSTSESRINGMIGGLIYERAKMYGLNLSREDAILKGLDLMTDLRDKGNSGWDEIELKFVSSGQGSWNDEGGMTAAEDILTANPNLDLILSENDFMGIGASRVANQMNVDVKIACAADGSREGMEYVKNGDMLCVGYNNGTMCGTYVIELIHKIFGEGYDANNLPLISAFDPVCINKDNVDQYYDANEPFAKASTYEFKTIDERNAQK